MVFMKNPDDYTLFVIVIFLILLWLRFKLDLNDNSNITKATYMTKFCPCSLTYDL